MVFWCGVQICRPGGAPFLRYSPDARSVVTLDPDGILSVWDTRRTEAAAQATDVSQHSGSNGSEGVFCEQSFALSPTGNHAVLTSRSGKMVLVPLQSLQKADVLVLAQHGASITAVDWHPSANVIATGSADSNVYLTQSSAGR